MWIDRLVSQMTRYDMISVFLPFRWNACSVLPLGYCRVDVLLMDQIR